MDLTKLTMEGGTTLAISSRGSAHGWWDTYSARQTAAIPDPPMIRGDTVNLEGAVHLEFAVGRRELVVPDIFAAGEKPIEAGGLSVVVKDARQWDREARITVKGMLKGEFCALRTLSPDYGLALRCPDGKLIEPRRGRSGYVAGGVDVDLVFDVERKPGKWSLVFRYPERTEAREYPFELKNVPLP
jgi:hypothetical protein